LKVKESLIFLMSNRKSVYTSSIYSASFNTVLTSSSGPTFSNLYLAAEEKKRRNNSNENNVSTIGMMSERLECCFFLYLGNIFAGK
jgi:hypothetical protein